MYSEIITNDECINCGRPGMVLESGMCPECHELVEWAKWCANQTDVIETGPVTAYEVEVSESMLDLPIDLIWVN